MRLTPGQNPQPQSRSIKQAMSTNKGRSRMTRLLRVSSFSLFVISLTLFTFLNLAPPNLEVPPPNKPFLPQFKLFQQLNILILLFTKAIFHASNQPFRTAEMTPPPQPPPRHPKPSEQAANESHPFTTQPTEPMMSIQDDLEDDLFQDGLGSSTTATTDSDYSSESHRDKEVSFPFFCIPIVCACKDRCRHDLFKFGSGLAFWSVR